MGLFDDERIKNLLLFKVYATDKEIEEMAPWLIGAFIVIIIIAIIIIIVS